jgi:hypothetical protein
MNIDAMTAALSAANLEQRSQSGLESMQEATNLPSLSDAAILGAIGIDLSGECDEIKLNVHKGTLSPSDLEIPLVGRQTNLTMIADMFTRTENACISLGSRTDYAIPVIVGVPGVGKTRLLHECRKLLPVDGATEGDCVASVFVVYNNGHSVTAADRHLPIELSFAARVVHQFFCDDIPGMMIFRRFMQAIVEKRQELLNFDLISALQCIRRALVTAKLLNPSGILRIFLGVDEIQAIEDSHAHDGDGPSVLRRLANHMLDASMQLRSKGIHLFSAMAGTEWPTYSCGSGEVMLKKISLHYLTVEASHAITHFLIPRALQSSKFLAGLTAFGDTPRTCVEFCRAILRLKTPDAKSIEKVEQSIMADCVSRFHTVLRPKDILRLGAFGIMQISCFPNDPSSIAGMTWQQLANKGLLQLVEGNLVVVSFSLLVHVANYAEQIVMESGSVEENFVRCVAHLVALVDANREPWQKWEDFGAYYHAVRMNAYVLTGRASVDLKLFFKEVYDGPSKTVTLRKSLVVIAQEQLHSSSDLTRVAEANNSMFHVSATDPDTCYVFLNSTGGKGVDIFFLLETAREQQILILDQRKLDNVTLSTSVVQDYHEKMVSVHPSAVGGRPVLPMYLLASARSKAGPRLQKPERMFIITPNTLRCNLGPMLPCAMSFVRVNPNTASVSALSQLLGIITTKHTRSWIFAARLR